MGCPGINHQDSGRGITPSSYSERLFQGRTEMDILPAPRFKPFAQDGSSQVAGRAVIEMGRGLNGL
jgi:hypothetical protein